MMKSLFIALFHLIACFGSRTAYGLQTVKSRPLSAAAVAARTTTTSTALVGKNKAVTLARRPKWGVDKDGHPDEYWFDQRIHSLGNVGISGALHAAVGPAFTKLIDWKAYNNVDIRRQLAERLSQSVTSRVASQQARVVDLCCGVGFSTRALKLAFKDNATEVLGVDTSKQMTEMAKFITSHIQTMRPYFGIRGQHCLKETEFITANAESTKLKAGSFDLVTVMYALHEAPNKGRTAILAEARRLLKVGGTLAVVDISTDYEPSPSMLMGEPYVQEYQATIHTQLKQFAGFTQVSYETVIPNHVGMWTLRRAAFA